jgi:hypothetical protein
MRRVFHEIIGGLARVFSHTILHERKKKKKSKKKRKKNSDDENVGKSNERKK